MFMYALGSFLQGMGKMIRPLKDRYTSSVYEDILKSLMKIYCSGKVSMTDKSFPLPFLSCFFDCYILRSVLLKKEAVASVLFYISIPVLSISA